MTLDLGQRAEALVQYFRTLQPASNEVLFSVVFFVSTVEVNNHIERLITIFSF